MRRPPRPKLMPPIATRPLLCLLAVPGLAVAQEPQTSSAFDVQPFLARWCTECHSGADPEAGVDLSAGLGTALDPEALDLLRDVADVLERGDMPPADEPQPDAAARTRVVDWADGLLASAAGHLPPDPGRVTMRRLSRFEYANTIRDLLGIEIDPARFPADDLAYGFDNVGEAMTLSTIQLEKLGEAAHEIALAALPDPDAPRTHTLDAALLQSSRGDGLRGDALVMLTNGHASGRFRLPRAGRYQLRVIAFATQAGDEPTRMHVRAGGQVVLRTDVLGDAAAPETFSVEIDVADRRPEIQVAFVNDFYRPDHPDRSRRDRNLFVQRVEMEGPLDEREPTTAQAWLLPLDSGRGRPATRAHRLVAALMERAWRRPVTRGEVTRTTRLVAAAVDAGETFEGGLRWALDAVLLSPHFLFRVEPTGGEDLPGAALATRLSYFLWSSLPDEELTTRARKGELPSEAALVAEARRMLRDERAGRLAREFAGQWLELRRIPELTPDPERFPEWDAELAVSARRETERLFETVLREGLPARRLIDADFTFVDRRLARHYGFAEPAGDEPVRVPLEGRRAPGILGHASFAALTSNPTRTSPVKRGRWILDNLLDDPPPPPPPGSDAFAAEATIDSSRSLREQMALHRSQPGCAVCHARMDPIGLAFESFDPIGRHRTSDAGGRIDTRATLPSGRVLDGPGDVARMIAGDGSFRRALLRKLFVFGVGRGIRPADALALDALARALPADVTLEDAILAIVRMDAFRRRSPAGD